MRDRRFKKIRKPNKVFLVICEGETEEVYVDLLRHHYRLPITIKTKVSGNTISSRLVTQYLRELGLFTEDDYKVFYIYDSDVKEVVDKLLTLQGTAILSNPSIEFWYYLHSKDLQHSVKSDTIIKMLRLCHPSWKAYAKGSLSNEQKKHLVSFAKAATARAKSLKCPENPSSNMYVFLEILESEKNH